MLREYLGVNPDYRVIMMYLRNSLIFLLSASLLLFSSRLIEELSFAVAATSFRDLIVILLLLRGKSHRNVLDFD